MTNGGGGTTRDNVGGWDFFVSYTRADQDWAEWIAWQLEETGHFQVLLQAWDMVPGTNFGVGMENGATRARHTIAVLSRAYSLSRFAMTEWRAAWSADLDGSKRKLLVARIEECSPPELYAQVVYFDLFDRPEDAARDVLVKWATLAISGGRARPTSDPFFPGGPGRRRDPRRRGRARPTTAPSYPGGSPAAANLAGAVPTGATPPTTELSAPRPPRPRTKTGPTDEPAESRRPAPPAQLHAPNLAATNRFAVLLPNSRHVRLDTPGVRPENTRRRRLQPVLIDDAGGIVAGLDGAIYVSVPTGHVVLRVGLDGAVKRVLGTGTAGYSTPTGPACTVRIDSPSGLAFDQDGLLYVADSGNGLIRRVDVVADRCETVVGARVDAPGGRRDPTRLVLRWPRAVAMDTNGRLLIADTENHRVLRVTLAHQPDGEGTPGIPATPYAEHLAGIGQPGDSGDGGPGAQARLLRPAGLVALPDGRVLIADTGNGRIRSVATTGQITTVEGGLYQTVTGTGPAALTGPMRAPTALAVAGDGTVFVVDNQDGRIRTFQAFSPRATTDISAPPGAWSSAAESVSKALRGPAGVAVWPAGGTAGLLATDASGSRIHVVRPDGLVGVLAVLPPGPP